MADLGKLKRRADKGIPPAPEQTNDNLGRPSRGGGQRRGKIQFSVPVEVLDEFAMQAGKRFGFRKGSKSKLFIAMWEDYVGRVGG